MDEAGIDAEVERRVEAIRQELQGAFDEKRRAAALQDRRARDRLERDRQEWEAHKRTERQRLAEEAETLRRRQESAARQLAQREQAREQFVQAKAKAEDRSASAEAVQEQAAARLAALETRVARASQTARWAGWALVVVAALAWGLSGLDKAFAALALVGVCGAAWIVLQVRRL